MKRISLSCILAAAVALTGCAEGTESSTDTNNGTGGCNTGATTCGSNNAYQVCENGVWGNLIPCDAGETCVNGSCSASGTDKCIENERQCTTAAAYKICVSGNWSSSIDCGKDLICRGGECVPDKSHSSGVSCLVGFKGCSSDGRVQYCGDDGYLVTADYCPTGKVCSNGDCVDQGSETQCDPSEAATCTDANTRRYCNSSGSYVSEVCSKGCENGACLNPETPECTGNTSICADSNTLKTCSNGKYVTTNCPKGCSNGACQNSETPECTGNTSICADSNTLKTCSNGQYVTTTCPKGCSNGACQNSETPECTGNTSICADSNTLKTCSNGKYVTTTCPKDCLNGQCTECSASESAVCASSTQIKYCSNGKYVTEVCDKGCSNGACKSTECNPSDAATCTNSSTRKYCTSAGKYATETCSYGCANGACNECNSSTVPTCTSSTTLKYCKNNSFASMTCQYGCENGACNTSSTPKVGDPCPSNFTDVCTNSTLYYCNSSTNTITSSACSSSSVTCATMSYGDDCVFTTNLCKAEGDKLFFSGNDCSEGVLFYLTCAKSSDGTLYGVLSAALSVCNGTYRVYCDSNTATDSSTEACTSCSYNASSYTATCENSTPQGSSTHTIGESCTSADQYKMGCAANTLVYCDGSKYVSYIDCSQYSGYYCDEQSAYGYADCVQSCSSEYENYIVDSSTTCSSSGEMELFVCEAGDSGNLGTFGGYYATSFCWGTTEYACSGSTQTSQTCSTCSNKYNSTSQVYEATCN